MPQPALLCWGVSSFQAEGREGCAYLTKMRESEIYTDDFHLHSAY
jgi:hypothetical protein